MAACQSDTEQNQSGDENSSEGPPFSAAYLEDQEIEGSDVENQFGEAEELNSRIESTRKNAITHAVELGSPAVVSIMATEPVQRPDNPRDEFFRFLFGEQMPRENTNMGSGFIISEDGLVVTNQHVVGSNPSEISISLGDGSTYDAELVGVDELTDIALIRIRSDNTLPFLEFTDSDNVIVG